MNRPLSAQRDNPIQGQGTSLAEWQSCASLRQVPAISLEELAPTGQRLVVVAPHPDDEVLACGGLLARIGGCDAELLLISVTDGEASHGDSLQWPRARLRRERPLESASALSRLGLDLQRLSWERLGLADSKVDEQSVVEHLDRLLRPGDQVLTSWRADGHCDHEAVGRAAARATARIGARLIEVPIWAWHWARPQDPRLPWSRARKLLLDPETLARKRYAIDAHISQVTPDRQAPPVLGAEAIERLAQPFELVFL
jgi:LmbE family N-acetylglucosaminyl deacetylase